MIRGSVLQDGASGRERVKSRIRERNCDVYIRLFVLW